MSNLSLFWVGYEFLKPTALSLVEFAIWYEVTTTRNNRKRDDLDAGAYTQEEGNRPIKDL